MNRAALLLPALLLAAGCSSGGDKADPKADYLAKVEPICAKANAEKRTLRDQAPTSLEAIAPYADRVLATAREVTRELEAQQPPEADRAALEREVFAPLRSQLADAEKYAAEIKAAAAAQNTARVFELAGQAPTKTRANIEFMRSYGFAECAKAADTGAPTG